MKKNINKQTLEEFINKPFGTKNEQKHLKYMAKYNKYISENKIRVEGTLFFEENFFIHFKVPSESNNKIYDYDVVIQFSPPSDESIKLSTSIRYYHVNFFSNSPGFVYKYCYLYNKNGMLIEPLYDKYSPKAIIEPPRKTNSEKELFYDSSIFYAAKYMIDRRLYMMLKLYIKNFKKKSFSDFFSAINNTEVEMARRDIKVFEKKLKLNISQESLGKKFFGRLFRKDTIERSRKPNNVETVSVVKPVKVIKANNGIASIKKVSTVKKIKKK